MRHKDGSRLGLAGNPTSTLPRKTVNALQNPSSLGRSLWGSTSTPSLRQKNQGLTLLQSEIGNIHHLQGLLLPTHH
ncbi:hypothetical protein DPMN_070608 [Dreissena polymorpha]|uniref:Uncharacterized protein n=1 Tax=Dreissena polymorpha TaxID=45954 RepID=A0A9D4BX83_DREPO|nr:hypothetical protein DPMN_070608 [Dreissena polymorpha]